MTVADPLRTLAEYELALREIEAFFKTVPEPGTEAAKRFERLAALIKQYEDENYPIGENSPKT